MPFAVVAVLILALSIASQSYLTAVSRRSADERSARLNVERMNAVADSVCAEVSTAAYSEGVRAVALATQFYENQSLVDGQFQKFFGDYLSKGYPSNIGGFSASITNYSVAISQLDMSCEDAVESTKNVSEEITTVDEDGVETKSPGRALDNSAPDELNTTNMPSFFVAAGCVSFTVESPDGLSVNKTFEFEKRITSPYPLLETKMGTFEGSGSGEFSSIARIVRYVLTTIAQFRVLQGYGSGISGSPAPTSSIIAGADIESAVNLAIVLEMARRFRTADAASLAGLGDGGSLGKLVRDYANKGTLDPADITALYLGIDESEVPIDAILAQGFNAVVDQFILKALDYLGIMDAVNKVYGFVASLVGEIEDKARQLSEWVGLSDGEGRENAAQVKPWVNKTMSRLTDADAPYPPRKGKVSPSISPHGGYARQFLAVSDIYQPVASRGKFGWQGTSFLSESTAQETNASGVVIGTEHVLAMRRLFCNLTTKTSAEMGLTVGYLVKFNETMATRAETDPLWSAFFEEKYKEGEDKIYTDLRDALKAICTYVAREVSEYFSGQDMSMARYMGGRYAVNPNDNSSVLDDLSEMVEGALKECFSYYSRDRAALKALLTTVIDTGAQLKEDLAQFIAANYGELADEDGLMSGARYSLGRALLDNASLSVSVSDFTSTYHTYNALGHSLGYADEQRPDYDYTGIPIDDAIRSEILLENAAEIQSLVQPYAEDAYITLASAEAGFVAPFSPANGYLIRALEEDALGTGNLIVDLILGLGFDSGFMPMAESFVLRSVKAIVAGGEGANVAYRPIVLLGRPFVLGDGDSSPVTEEPTVRMTPPHLRGASKNISAAALPIGSFDYYLSKPNGTHYTDMLAYNAKPFETTWRLVVGGSFDLEALSGDYDLLVNGSHAQTRARSTVELLFNCSISVYSGWGLEGVEYVNSASLAEDMGKLADLVKEFFSWVLDSIMAPIKWLVDQVMKVVDVLSNVLNRLLSYAQRILQLLSDLIQMAVEMLQRFVKDVAADVLDSIVGWLLDWLPDGLEINFELFGFKLSVVFDPESALGDESNETTALLVLNISAGFLGAKLWMGMTVFDLGENESAQSGSDYDILFYAGIKIKGFWLDIAIDPLMALREHIAECSGGGDGWRLELVLPEVERRYDSVVYSLQDMPAIGPVLQNIYIPCLGAKASVDAGFRVAYTDPGLLPDHVVMNEVELNPRGCDNGTEWVELFNPLKEPMNVTGWTLDITSNGTLGNRTITFGNGSIISPRGYLWLNLTNESLDDRGALLRLLASNNSVIDDTPWLREAGGASMGNQTIPPTGSSMTWQRSPNGADADIALDWAFREGTPGESNGAGNATFEELVELLMHRAFESASKEAGEMQLSFDYFIDLASNTVHKFIEDVLDVVETSVIEIEFFIDARLSDATGTGGIGFRLSFVIEGGECARQILEWMIGTLEAFAKNLFRPSSPSKYPKLASGVPEHLFIRFQAYGDVSIPKMLDGTSGDQSSGARLKLVGTIGANIPALAAIVGRDLGRWRVVFGLYLENFPGKTAHRLFGTPEDENVDVWILKGTAYEV